MISIHALREEGDKNLVILLEMEQNFNPRPPRGGRHDPPGQRGRCEQFQSTPSARRATRMLSRVSWQCQISIHALREEGDLSVLDTSVTATVFQSTPSARRATCRKVRCAEPLQDFNPRPPRGGRHSHFESQAVFLLFQSTPSARRATEISYYGMIAAFISIHALREEGDQKGPAGHR